MLGFENMIEKLGPNLEKSVEILVEHSKMRKDASKLRNHDSKMQFVELDVLFLLIITTALKNGSLRRNPVLWFFW